MIFLVVLDFFRKKKLLNILLSIFLAGTHCVFVRERFYIQPYFSFIANLKTLEDGAKVEIAHAHTRAHAHAQVKSTKTNERALSTKLFVPFDELVKTFHVSPVTRYNPS